MRLLCYLRTSFLLNIRYENIAFASRVCVYILFHYFLQIKLLVNLIFILQAFKVTDFSVGLTLCYN